MLERQYKPCLNFAPICMANPRGPCGGATFETNGSGLQVRLVPDDTRLPRPVTRNDTRMRIACVRFVQFLLAESHGRLAGPCKHCDKYFVLKGKQRTTYCSRRCCQLDSAANYTKKTAQ